MPNPITTKELIPAGYTPGAKQQHLLEEMVKLINDLQIFLGVQIKVGSGLRTAADVERLIKQGYNPSRTSDHFYGIPVTQKDGSVFADSVGATDLYITGLAGLFGRIVARYQALPMTDWPHQIIYETGKSGDWLHIANKVSSAYAADLAPKMVSKRPLLYSFDNGKSYVVFDPKNPPEKLK